MCIAISYTFNIDSMCISISHTFNINPTCVLLSHIHLTSILHVYFYRTNMCHLISKQLIQTHANLKSRCSHSKQADSSCLCLRCPKTSGAMRFSRSWPFGLTMSFSQNAFIKRENRLASDVSRKLKRK